MKGDGSYILQRASDGKIKMHAAMEGCPMRPLFDIIQILRSEMLAETGYPYTFYMMMRGDEAVFRVIPEGDDDGFYRHWFQEHGVKWYTDAFQAVDAFYMARMKWNEFRWRMRAQSENTASLLASTWPHPGKAGSVLP